MSEPNFFDQLDEPPEEPEKPGLLRQAGEALGIVEPEEVAQPAPVEEGNFFDQLDQPGPAPVAPVAPVSPTQNFFDQTDQRVIAPTEEIGGGESFWNYILRGTGGTGTGILQAAGLAAARSPDLLGIMDEYESAKTDEEREAVESKANLRYRPRGGGAAMVPMTGSTADWETWQEYVAAEDELSQAKIRVGLMTELNKAMEQPLYQAGESFDQWVRDNAPVQEFEEGSWESFFKAELPQGIGSMVSFVGAALATRGAVGRAAPALARTKTGAWALGVAGAGIPGAAVNYSGMFNDAIQEGADIETAFEAAERGGYIGVLEGVPIAQFLTRADKGSGGAVSRYFKDVAIQGSEEAVQEGMNNLLNNWVAQGLYDPDRQIWGDDVQRAAGLGLTTGALMEAVFGLLPGRRRAKLERGEVSDPADDPARIIEQRMQEAERAALEAGADPLAAKNAAALAGQELAAELDEETGTAAETAAEQAETDEAVLADIETERELTAAVAALRRVQAQQGARKALDEAPTPEQAEALEGEEAVEEADRLSQQEQAAERYEKGARRVREEPAFEEAEEAAAERREAELTEMEVERPPPEGPAEAPRSPAMQEAFEEAQRQEAAKREEEARPKPIPEERRIEGRPADFAVTPEGEVQPTGVQPRVQPPAQEPGIERPFVRDDDDVSYRIDEEAEEAATSPTNEIPEPTQAQIDAGNYKKGHIALQGLDITIENPKGSTRSSKPGAAKQWSQKMQSHYGYIRRTEGADGEQIDTFIGENPTNDRVFVIDQIDQQSGDFDEHKAMIGFNNRADAKRGYLRNYEKGWKAGPITEMSMDQFKDWIKSNPPRRPASGVDLGAAYSPELAEAMSGELGPGDVRPPMPEVPAAALARLEKRRITDFDRALDRLVYDRTRTDEEIAAKLDEYDAERAGQPDRYEGWHSERLVAEMDRLLKELAKPDQVFLTQEEQDEIRRDLEGRPPQEGDLKYRLDDEASQQSLPGIDPVAPDFYSRMKETVQKKLPNRIGEAQLFEWQNARVKAGDFNQAEADFIDLPGEFVTAEGNSVVTKDDILDHLEVRQPDIIEMILTTNLVPPREYTSAEDTMQGIRDTFGPNASYNEGVFDTTYNNNQTYNIFDEHHVIVGAIKPTGGKRRDLADITIGTVAPDFTWTVSSEIAEHLQPQHDNAQLFDADTNYREILYQLPYSGAFMSRFKPPPGHWPSDQHANTLAHVRMSDAQNAQGEPVMFVQEIQSDWHQGARDVRKAEVWRRQQTGKTKAQAEELVPKDYGYAPAEIRRVYDQKVALAEAGLPTFENWISQVLNRNPGVVEDAPFKRDWPIMVMKRLINRAITEGYSEVTWAKGFDIANQWSMAHEVGMVEFNADTEKAYIYSEDGTGIAEGYYDEQAVTEMLGASAADRLWDVAREEMAIREQYSVAEEPNEDGTFHIIDPNGEPMYAWGGDPLTVEDSTEIQDVLREHVESYQLPGWRSNTIDVAGEGIIVGGEGMRGFYDAELVNKVNKYLKKLGSKAVDTVIDVGDGADIPAWGFPITDKMRQALVMRGQPMFRRGEEDVAAPPPRTLTQTEGQAALDPMIKELGGLDVEVVGAASDLPPNLFARLQRDKALKAKGFYHHATGKIYILAGNHETTEDLARTLLHEGVAHRGLRALLTNEGDLNAFLDEVAASPADQVAFDEMHRKYRHDQWTDQTAARRATAEELVAHMAETQPDSSFVKRAVAMIRNALRQMGVGLKWTDDDIYSLLRDTRRALKRIELDTIEVTTPAQVAETGEIIDVGEGADVALRQLDKRTGVVQSLQECLGT